MKKLFDPVYVMIGSYANIIRIILVHNTSVYIN